MDKLFWDKINMVKPSHYLIANPFSKIANEDISGQISFDLFFNKFHVISNKTYERLAEIISVVQSLNENTIFVTGFRGSGKTTFVNYVMRVINGRQELAPFNETMEKEKEIIDKMQKEKDEEEVVERYLKSKQEIKHLLQSQFASNIIDHGMSDLHKYFQKALSGRAIYLNFEKGRAEKDPPIEQKLNAEIKSYFKNILDGKKTDILSSLVLINETCNDSIQEFESMEDLPFGNFFDFLYEIRDSSDYTEADYKKAERKLDEILSPLKISQLLCIMFLINICEEMNKETMQRLYYFFDNIDIIYDFRILDDFLESFSKFVVNMAELMSEINEKHIFNERRFEFYEDIIIIFVMRETTTMLINDHFEDRLQNFSKHFDISQDIDKGYFIYRKNQFIAENIEKISNSRLVTGIQTISQAISDSYVKRTIYALFNNDFKRAVSCLALICDDDRVGAMQEQIELISMPNVENYHKYGARSLLLRLIFNHFMEQKYFSKIGVDSRVYRKLKYTPARILLTYLYNYQPDHNDKYLVSDQDTVTLFTMFNELSPLFGGNGSKSLDVFIDALWGMFHLRISNSWNHLVTFDSIKTVTKDAIANSIIKEEESIKVRITCAGRSYLRNVCTHFEFYASRYARQYSALFSKINGDYDTAIKGYRFEKLIDHVYKHVKECAQLLFQSEENIFFKTMGFNRFDLLDEKYFYIDRNGDGMAHAERVIHAHISYLDSYRLYLVNGRYKNNVVDINQRMINKIKMYLDLMQPCEECDLPHCFECGNSSYNTKTYDGTNTKKMSGHFSKNNADLFRQFLTCIEYIVERKRYNDTNTEISRIGYKKLISDHTI